MNISRGIMVATLGLLLWSGWLPVALAPLAGQGIAFAKGGTDDRGGGNSGGGSGSHGGSGSGGSGSGSSGSGGSGSGSSGSGGSGSDDTGGGSDDSGHGSGTNSGPSSSGAGGLWGDDISAQQGSENHLYGDNAIQLVFSDGSLQRILGTRYELIDPSGHLREDRSATRSDLMRLRALGEHIGGQQTITPVESVLTVDGNRDAVQIVDFRGWRETVIQGVYALTDPNGHTVTRRPTRQKDVRRIRNMLGLR